jgi:Na+-translocating ferredoxin:NAD+ oxidoreductase RnfG subunit
MKIGFAILSGLLVLALLRPALGVVLLTQDRALKQVFPDASKIASELHVLTPVQSETAKARLGGKWALCKPLARDEDTKDPDSLTFYFGMKDGKKTGVALVDVQPGLWGPMKYIVALDLAGKVTNLAVMSYVDQRGRTITTRRFLDQFVGKTGSSPITVGKDIDAVSGATLSCRATAFAVKKVVVLYETVFSPAEKKDE